jgi:hypothetical protein
MHEFKPVTRPIDLVTARTHKEVNSSCLPTKNQRLAISTLTPAKRAVAAATLPKATKKLLIPEKKAQNRAIPVDAASK